MKTESQTLPGPATSFGLTPPKQGMVEEVSFSSSTIIADFWKVSHLLSQRELRRPRKGDISGSFLKEAARRNPPPAEWYEGEDERPF
jgi:hypothetical protein